MKRRKINTTTVSICLSIFLVSAPLSLTDEPILVKLNTVAVYDLQMRVKEVNHGPNYS